MVLIAGAPPETLRAIDGAADAEGRPLCAAGLALDHRQLRPGEAFVALAGSRGHGLDHLGAALAAGAAGVLVDADEPRPVDTAMPVARVPRLRSRLGEFARQLHGDVDRRLALIGVTGTDGKTSVSHFVAQLLDRPGARCAVLGTVGNGFLESLSPASHTTADVLQLYRALADLAGGGAARVAIEVSSHALDQDRVAGLRFAVAALTNLGVDHLDYHGDRAAYGAAKARLFDGRARHAVLNADDAFCRSLRPQLSAATTVGARAGADWRARAIRYRPAGLSLELERRGRRVALELGLLGAFNVANALCAAAVAERCGLAEEDILQRLPALVPVAGRAELLAAGAHGPAVVIDYAHTAQALAAILSAVRAHVPARLWCVFGCGGDRDRGKRPAMAAAAARGADRLVITTDNPRGECPRAIIEEIRAGVPAGVGCEVQVDRAAAIDFALSRARPDDCVLIAGKGHEDYQEVGGRRLPFSDRAQVLAWREARR